MLRIEPTFLNRAWKTLRYPATAHSPCSLHSTCRDLPVPRTHHTCSSLGVSAWVPPWPETLSSKLSKESFPNFPIKTSFCPALSLSPSFDFLLSCYHYLKLFCMNAWPNCWLCVTKTGAPGKETLDYLVPIREQISRDVNLCLANRKHSISTFWRNEEQRGRMPTPKVRRISQSTRGWIGFWFPLDAAHPSREYFEFKNSAYGNFLVVQWLGLGAFTAEGLGLIPGWGTKIPQAAWAWQE